MMYFSNATGKNIGRAYFLILTISQLSDVGLPLAGPISDEELHEKHKLLQANRGHHSLTTKQYTKLTDSSLKVTYKCAVWPCSWGDLNKCLLTTDREGADRDQSKDNNEVELGEPKS